MKSLDCISVWQRSRFIISLIPRTKQKTSVYIFQIAQTLQISWLYQHITTATIPYKMPSVNNTRIFYTWNTQTLQISWLYLHIEKAAIPYQCLMPIMNGYFRFIFSKIVRNIQIFWLCLLITNVAIQSKCLIPIMKKNKQIFLKIAHSFKSPDCIYI